MRSAKNLRSVLALDICGGGEFLFRALNSYQNSDHDVASRASPPTAGHRLSMRRRVEPLELALREGQLACAAALIEGGAHINERTLRAVKLEPSGTGVTEDKR